MAAALPILKAEDIVRDYHRWERVFRERRVEGAFPEGTDLSGIDTSGSDWSGVRMPRAYMERTVNERTVFTGIYAPDSSWAESRNIGAVFDMAILEDVEKGYEASNFEDANNKDSYFREVRRLGEIIWTGAAVQGMHVGRAPWEDIEPILLEAGIGWSKIPEELLRDLYGIDFHFIKGDMGVAVSRIKEAIGHSYPAIEGKSPFYRIGQLLWKTRPLVARDTKTAKQEDIESVRRRLAGFAGLKMD